MDGIAPAPLADAGPACCGTDGVGGAASLDVALDAVRSLLLSGTVPELPVELRQNARLGALLEQLTELQRFCLSIARGDLSPQLQARGLMAGSLKDLQANLRHLTWQAQVIAGGDFGQRVDFMGEFAAAFNSMVASLAQARVEVEQHQAAIQQQLAAQERLIAELDAFAHTVAHDLANSLGLVIGYANLLADRFDEMPVQRMLAGLRVIERTGQKMNNVMQELMLLHGVRKTEPGRELLDMAPIVDEALRRLATLVDDTGAEIVLPAAWPVGWGYGPWVEEVWVNYIGNACKYGGQPPHVELGGEPLGDGRVCFWVGDNGPGLAPEEQAALFVPFTRLAQARAGGHGLGLSIVRRIADKLGGQAGVESQGIPGRGCRFYLILPGVEPAGGPASGAP